MTADTQSSLLDRRQIIGDVVAQPGIDEPGIDEPGIDEPGIDEPMIERLVRAFYERARRDPLIGPIFNSKVPDWEKHIERQCAFWSSVALMSGRYHGQPMVAHLPLPVDTPEFDRWLEIFAETAGDVCPPRAAAHFLERAHRIADSLEMGIAAQKGEIRRKRPRPERSMPGTQEVNRAL